MERFTPAYVPASPDKSGSEKDEKKEWRAVADIYDLPSTLELLLHLTCFNVPFAWSLVTNRVLSDMLVASTSRSEISFGPPCISEMIPNDWTLF